MKALNIIKRVCKLSYIEPQRTMSLLYSRISSYLQYCSNLRLKFGAELKRVSLKI